ncbi:uncharacterized protein C8A04DRAFT_33754 [Dichotomopilus funicola]|uniref:Uncharacterized protein n=1 Tax=Dichotomopilus funicola TaxID=1934379 RepID=A0AAN6VBC5_9PEZI|nr:hypothetical protein C8A04DRAFT_33754 [Dichotomopilus funicola]
MAFHVGPGDAAHPVRRPLQLRLSQSTATLALAAAFLPTALGHEGHHMDKIPEGEAISLDPIDTTLWVHIFVQMLAFGILFPVGMVLGIVKSRWHVPVQIFSTALAVLGFALGYWHGGRQFNSNNVHVKAATPLFFLMVAQVVLGLYLKLHLERGIHGRIRPVFRILHSINGKAFPVYAWVQMVFGGITALGFCQGDHIGQCLAHFIMGGAFIAYGVLLTILLLVGQIWLRRTGRSQEFFDSAVIAAWGCVNTFTEHRWGTAWVRNDWQHTSMGIIWWSAGLVGVWLSRDRHGAPKRNFIPGFVILITGWGMSAHPQELMISAMTHKMFGYTLMAAGITRIIEVSFILRDKPGISEDGTEINSFQFIPVFLLYAAGFLFMGATEEQMALLAASGMDHVAYVLILYSLASLVFLFTMALLQIYDRANPLPKPVVNGHAVRGDDARLRDVNEFELDGLVSDDEDEERATRRKLLRDDGLEDGPDTPSTVASTVGRNSDRVA